MRIGKIIVSIVLIVALGGGWFNILQTARKEHNQYNAYIIKADDSFNQGLYLQAIEEYKSAIGIKPSLELWRKVNVAYRSDYNQRADNRILMPYITDMQTAANAFPKEKDFWITVINLQNDNKRYVDAYKTAKQAAIAINNDDELQEIVETLRYKTETGYKTWKHVTVPHTGYVTVSNEITCSVLNDKGETIHEGFDYIGPINKNGSGVYETTNGFRLIDSNGVERAILPDAVNDAGLYNESVGLVPLRIGAKWQYFDVNNVAFEGHYDSASAFSADKAVVAVQGRWRVIDSKGETIDELTFDDVKFGVDGGFIQNEIIIAQSDGKWHLFNTKYDQIGNFAADDIDVYLGEAIAFCVNGKWGFVDSNGDIVIEPTFQEAKSFSCGLAGVKNEDGQWGFINDAGRLVIPTQFQGVDYFTESGSCYTMKDDNRWQELRLINSK